MLEGHLVNQEVCVLLEFSGLREGHGKDEVRHVCCVFIEKDYVQAQGNNVKVM